MSFLTAHLWLTVHWRARFLIIVLVIVNPLGLTRCGWGASGVLYRSVAGWKINGGMEEGAIKCSREAIALPIRFRIVFDRNGELGYESSYGFITAT